MPTRTRSRREVILDCLAGGALLVWPGWGEADVLAALAPQKRTPTARTEVGPFYKKRAPGETTLRKPGDAGLPLAVAGRVLTINGEPVPGAKLEIWQADDAGLYDLDGYRFRTALAPSPSGAYAVESVMPGHYPARVARHIHYLVTAPGFKPLATQLYFSTDEAFEGNPAKNFKKDPLVTSLELVRPVTLGGTKASPHASVAFDLVLEKA